MPNPVQFDISVGSLPEGLDTDPQGLLEAFAARLIISPSVPWSSFVLGAAQPTSDLGPWFKDGQTLWVWDDGLATYIPQILDDQSLRYKVAAADPGAADYQLWIDTATPAVKWSNGAVWTDVIAARLAAYSTTSQMNTAITNAIAAIPASSVGQGAFSATPSVQQDIVFGGAGNQTGVVALGTENFDPDGVFAGSVFVTPATGYYQFNWATSVSTSGGPPTEVDILIRLNVAGVPQRDSNNIDGPFTKTGGIFVGSALLYLTLGQQVDLRYDVTVDAACTVEIQPGGWLDGHRIR